jgi:hypothetical protein
MQERELSFLQGYEPRFDNGCQWGGMLMMMLSSAAALWKQEVVESFVSVMASTDRRCASL